MIRSVLGKSCEINHKNKTKQFFKRRVWTASDTDNCLFYVSFTLGTFSEPYDVVCAANSTSEQLTFSAAFRRPSRLLSPASSERTAEDTKQDKYIAVSKTERRGLHENVSECRSHVDRCVPDIREATGWRIKSK